MQSKDETKKTPDSTLEEQITAFLKANQYTDAHTLVKTKLTDINSERDGFLVKELWSATPPNNVMRDITGPFIVSLMGTKAGLKLLEKNPGLLKKCDLNKQFETPEGIINIAYVMVRIPKCTEILSSMPELLLGCDLNSALSNGEYKGFPAMYFLWMNSSINIRNFIARNPQIIEKCDLNAACGPHNLMYHLATYKGSALFGPNPHLLSRGHLNSSVGAADPKPLWYTLLDEDFFKPVLKSMPELFPTFDYSFLKSLSENSQEALNRYIYGNKLDLYRYMLTNEKLPPGCFNSSLKEVIQIQKCYSKAFKLAKQGKGHELASLLELCTWLCTAKNQSNTLLHYLVVHLNNGGQVYAMTFLKDHEALFKLLAPCQVIKNNDEETPAMCADFYQLKEKIRGEVSPFQRALERILLNDYSRLQVLVSYISGQSCLGFGYVLSPVDSEFVSANHFLKVVFNEILSLTKLLDEPSNLILKQTNDKIKKDSCVINECKLEPIPLNRDESMLLQLIIHDLIELRTQFVKPAIEGSTQGKQRKEEAPGEAVNLSKKAKVSEQSIFAPRAPEGNPAESTNIPAQTLG